MHESGVAVPHHSLQIHLASNGAQTHRYRFTKAVERALSLPRPNRTCCATARVAAVASISHDEFANLRQRDVVATANDNTPASPGGVCAPVLPQSCKLWQRRAVLAFIQPGRVNKILS
jgi:hypothetical protein